MSSDGVVDASVGIKLFLVEEFSEEVDRLFNRLRADPPAHFYVPDLFYVECANILWKYTRRFGYPADNARRDVRDLRVLPLRTVSTADLLEPALELALAYDLTAYDASYAALGQRLNLPFFTADQTLQRKLSDSGITVFTLADLATGK
jgi:predicted nucleic acid-binding protein